MNTIKVSAPATIANIVCGFDVLGMALDSPNDIMEVALLSEARVVIKTRNEFSIPLDPKQNTAGAALLAMMDELSNKVGFEVTIEKNIKPGSGIGSSAASAAGAVVAANELTGKKFSKEDLVRFAMCGEKVASGVKHADNVGPCIYGGITLIRCINPLDIVCIPAPELFITVIHPQIEVKTSDARAILRKEVLLRDAIKQWGNVAGLVAGFMSRDYELIGRSLEDVIIEPVRRILIPGFADLKKNCKEAGALGGGISGSGPSVFMLSKDKNASVRVEEAMKNVYDKLSIEYHTYVTSLNLRGVTVIT